MQNGTMMRTERHGGPDVWEFRRREPGPDGKRKDRRMVVGTTNEFDDEVAARQAIAGLHLRMNAYDSLAGLIVTFFSGICLEQNLGPDRARITKMIDAFMRLICAI